LIPSNDFSYYDQVLDAAMSVGAIPARYRKATPLEDYFAMARGGRALAALEMTKWFDTNYHYIVPEIETPFVAQPDAAKMIDEFREAHALGITTCPVLIGPVTFMLLAKHVDTTERFAELGSITTAYGALLRSLLDAGVHRIQLDEPCLVLDLDDAVLAAYPEVYRALASAAPGLHLSLATYFGPLPERHVATVAALPIGSLHLDLTRRAQPLDELLRTLPAATELSLGIVDGRNIWQSDLSKALTTLELIAEFPYVFIVASLRQYFSSFRTDSAGQEDHT